MATNSKPAKAGFFVAFSGVGVVLRAVARSFSKEAAFPIFPRFVPFCAFGYHPVITQKKGCSNKGGAILFRLLLLPYSGLIWYTAGMKTHMPEQTVKWAAEQWNSEVKPRFDAFLLSLEKGGPIPRDYFAPHLPDQPRRWNPILRFLNPSRLTDLVAAREGVEAVLGEYWAAWGKLAQALSEAFGSGVCFVDFETALSCVRRYQVCALDGADDLGSAYQQAFMSLMSTLSRLSVCKPATLSKIEKAFKKHHEWTEEHRDAYQAAYNCAAVKVSAYAAKVFMKCCQADEEIVLLKKDGKEEHLSVSKSRTQVWMVLRLLAKSSKKGVELPQGWWGWFSGMKGGDKIKQYIEHLDDAAVGPLVYRLKSSG